MFMTVFFSFLVFLGMLIFLNEGDIILDYIWALYNNTIPVLLYNVFIWMIDVTIVLFYFFN